MGRECRKGTFQILNRSSSLGSHGLCAFAPRAHGAHGAPEPSTAVVRAGRIHQLDDPELAPSIARNTPIQKYTDTDESMSIQLEIPESLFVRIQKHAIPFVDLTPISVIERWADHFEGQQKGANGVEAKAASAATAVRPHV